MILQRREQTPLLQRLRTFSLRLLLLTTTGCCVLLSVWRTAVRPYQLQEIAAANVVDRGGSLRTRPAGSRWLAGLLGKERFQEIIEVDFQQLSEGAEYSELFRDMPALETLRVGRNFTDEDMRHARNCKQLRRLFLKHSQVTDDGLNYCRDMRYLRLAELGRNITDDGMSVFLGKRRLAYLELSRTQVTDRGLEHLKELPRLHKVFLNDRPITDRGLSILRTLPALDEVYLVGCDRVSDQGLRKLGELKQLRQLDISQTAASYGTFKHLERQLVQARVMNRNPGY